MKACKKCICRHLVVDIGKRGDRVDPHNADGDVEFATHFHNLSDLSRCLISLWSVKSSMRMCSCPVGSPGYHVLVLAIDKYD